jgi:hypothetical protein
MPKAVKSADVSHRAACQGARAGQVVAVLITVTVPRPAPLVPHRYGEVNRAIQASLTAMVMVLPASDYPVTSVSVSVSETGNDDAPVIYFKDLMAKIGYFLFYWASLEQELIRGIISARIQAGMGATDIPVSMTDRLVAWRTAVCAQPDGTQYAEVADQVQRQTLALRDIRNHIVHGLQGGMSHSPDGPHIICSKGKSNELHTETVTYRYGDLEHFMQGVDACRRAFIHAQNFNYSIDFRETSAG